MSSHLQRLLPVGSRRIPNCLQSLVSRTFSQSHVTLCGIRSSSAGKMNVSSSFVFHSQSQIQIGAFPTAAVQLTRCYRVKKDANLTIIQEFVCKVSKVASSDERTLNEFCSRLNYLTEKGCKACELVEYPEILKITEYEMEERIQRLRSYGISDISIPLLKFAKPENSDAVVKNSLRRYAKQQNGRVNKVDEIQEALRCTEDEMLEILTRNPRLVGNRKRKFIVEKVNCLLECGALLEDIRCNTNLLNNKTLEDIENRARHLANMGYNNPLPIGVIGRDDKDYAVIVKRLEKLKSLHPKHQYVESKDIIGKIPEYANKKLYVVKPKVDFLLSLGYVADDIIQCPIILELSLATIQETVMYLQQYHLGLVSLEQCHKYATKKRVTASRPNNWRSMLAKVLRCSVKDLSVIPKDLKISFSEEATLHRNSEYLQSLGFTTAELQKLPIVLVHSINTLEFHWEVIQSDEVLSLSFKQWKGDWKRLLDLLQYSIEKESGFSYASVPDLTNEQNQLELNNLVTQDYESVELSQLHRDTREYKELGSSTECNLEDGRDSDAELDSKLENELNVKIDSVEDHSPNVKAQSNVDHSSNVDHNSNLAPDSDEVLNSEVVLDSEVVHDSEVVPESDVVLNSEVVLDSDVVHDSEVVPESDVVLNSEVALDSDVVFDSDTVPESDVVLNSEVVLDSDTVLDSNMILDSNTVAVSEVEHESPREHDPDLQLDSEVNLKNIVELDPLDIDNVEIENTEQKIGMDSLMTELYTKSADSRQWPS